MYVAFIGFFNYYYTFLQLDPADVSDQLKRQGASIPLVRPGKATATYITTVCPALWTYLAVFQYFVQVMLSYP